MKHYGPITTKRQRRMLRNRYRRRRARLVRLLQRPVTSEETAEKHNRWAKAFNFLVNSPEHKGASICEGYAECPECGAEVWLMADPCEWQQRLQPRWRRKRRNGPAYKVTDYWGGIGECCKGFIAAQPDGECHFYPFKDAV